MKNKSFVEMAVQFINEDVRERKETIVSDMTFLAALVQLKVKTESGKTKIVTYSAAGYVLKGYRAMKLKQNFP